MKTIEIITIPFTDPRRAKAFYTGIGFEVLVEASMPNGETWIQLGLPGQTTSIA